MHFDRHWIAPLIWALLLWGIVIVGLARGADVESYKFDPGDNGDVVRFLDWLGITKLTDDQVRVYWSERGVEPFLIEAAIAAEKKKCGEPEDFLGFFRHPTEPGVGVICNGPPRDQNGRERGFTPEEAANICRIWGTDFGAWFPGSPERPPELECVRPVRPKQSNRPAGRLKPGDLIELDTASVESYEAFFRAIGASEFLHPRAQAHKAICDSKGWNWAGSWRGPTGRVGSFGVNPLPISDEEQADRLCKFGGLAFHHIVTERPSAVVCMKSPLGASMIKQVVGERDQELFSPEGFSVTNVVIRWSVPMTTENQSERGFTALWNKWEADCNAIKGEFDGITSNYERQTQTGFCLVPKIRSL